MKVKVDNKLPVSLFGSRIVRQQPRYYYQVVGYDCLVLTFWDGDYIDWHNQIGVALFNFDDVNGRIICEEFPKAPSAWRDEPHLIGCTVRAVRRLPDTRPKWLSAAIREMVGEGC